VTLIIVIMTIAPILTTMATSNQIQQTSNCDNPARESSPSASTYWAKTYGGNNYDSARSVQQTSDGGYIVAGATESFGTTSRSIWVLKLNSAGSVVWQKTYGSNGTNWASSIQQTSDGGYIVAGGTHLPSAGYDNAWVLKLNSTGSVMWQKIYGNDGMSDGALSVQQTLDGGYIIAGYTYSLGVGYGDAWVLKLDSTGSVTWQKSYGGNGSDGASSIQQTSDGGYIVAGDTSSFGAGGYDVWVFKLNSTGSVTWQNTYGGSADDSSSSVQQTSDGGYVVAGDTESFGAGFSDVWILKLNSSSSVTWQKTYGGSGYDYMASVGQTSGGGYIVAGDTSSFGAGGYDVWVFKLNSTGSVTWQNTYGGSNVDSSRSIRQTSDGGYIVGGETTSFGAGWYDAWVVKLGAIGDIVWDAGSGASNRTTSATPSDSSAVVSTTSVTPADSAAIAQSTQAGTHDSNATVTVQSGSGGLTAQEIQLITIVSLAAAAVVAVVLVAVVLAKKKRTPTKIT
jgi:uncharacterized delta-60 repeat protein